MNRWIAVAVAVSACQPGFKPSDVEGVCVEMSQEETNPTWVSDEKPPTDKMPSYQREGIKLIDVKSTAAADAKADQDKADADAAGKAAAGIK